MPETVPSTLKVQKLVLQFVVGQLDEAGRLLGEQPAPQTVTLYHPFAVTAESLQALVQQVEDQLNPPAVGG
jgi:hypothetical protein